MPQCGPKKQNKKYIINPKATTHTHIPNKPIKEERQRERECKEQ